MGCTARGRGVDVAWGRVCNTICENEEETKKSNGEPRRRRRCSLETRRKTLIDDEPPVGSMNRKHLGEALDDMIAVVSSDSIDDARIGSNCSLELSSELELLPNFSGQFREVGMNMRKSFCDSECARQGEAGLYIYSWGSDEVEIRFKFGFYHL
jgi:hypothetical protein